MLGFSTYLGVLFTRELDMKKKLLTWLYSLSWLPPTECVNFCVRIVWRADLIQLFGLPRHMLFRQACTVARSGARST